MLINLYIIVLIVICVVKVKSAYIVGWMVQGHSNTIDLKMKTKMLPIFVDNFKHHSNISHFSSLSANSFIGNQFIDNKYVNSQEDNQINRENDQMNQTPENESNEKAITNRPDTNQSDHFDNYPLNKDRSTIGHRENMPSIHKSGDLASAGLSLEDKLRCKVNSDCLSIKKETYCDYHYGQCRETSNEGELCRLDEHCSHNMICIFGKCARPKEIGKMGSRCLDDSDCDSDHCCARLLGSKICKPKLKLHQKCFIPYGGLDYSLNESCPCVDGLVCEPTEHDDPNVLPLRKMKPKNPRIEHLRCTI